MAYTRYQCEWQRINNIKEKAEVFMSVFDFNRFYDVANNIPIGHKNTVETLNRLYNDTSNAITGFQMSLDMTDKNNVLFWNGIVDLFEPFLLIMNDIQNGLAVVDISHDNFMEKIPKCCSPAFVEYMQKSAETKECDWYIAIRSYIVYKAQELRSLHFSDNLKRFITMFTSHLEANNKMLLNV